jgi:hypothetical protein
MMIEGDDGNCYCLFADERYLDTPVFLGCHLLPDKIEKVPTALLFCVGCLWIDNDDSSCVALKSCMAGSLECIDLFYLPC